MRRALWESRAVIFVTAGALLFLVSVYLCEADIGGGVPCAATEGLGLAGLLAGLAEPLRRRMMRRWPERRWPDGFWFLVLFSVSILVVTVLLAAIT
ncbi:MAG: hypothetical protein HZA24_11830 [Nitrospirae bacterium]|nr:hypothetical protein [Nitrospirota bacterium]